MRRVTHYGVPGTDWRASCGHLREDVSRDRDRVTCLKCKGTLQYRSGWFEPEGLKTSRWGGAAVAAILAVTGPLSDRKTVLIVDAVEACMDLGSDDPSAWREADEALVRIRREAEVAAQGTHCASCDGHSCRDID